MSTGPTLTPEEREIVERIARLLQDMQQDAYARFAACRADRAKRASNSFCEIARNEAMAYRKARRAVMDAFPAQDPANDAQPAPASDMSPSDTGSAQ